jgi:hypothetical protein
MSPKTKDRLFVPLTTESFLDFKLKGKQYEIRACEKAYSEKYVFPGRPVELRKGYSGESLHGIIGEIVMGSHLEQVLSLIDYKLAEPRANSIDEAVKENKKLLGEKPKYIAFQVLLDNKERVIKENMQE